MKKVIVVIIIVLGYNSASELGWLDNKNEKVKNTISTSVQTHKTDTVIAK